MTLATDLRLWGEEKEGREGEGHPYFFLKKFHHCTCPIAGDATVTMNEETNMPPLAFANFRKTILITVPICCISVRPKSTYILKHILHKR
jgi:hypothetical protein